MKFWVVVPAAGIGSRIGGDRPKQYLPLHGRAVIEHSLERLLSLAPQGLVVALHPDDQFWYNLAVRHHPRIRVVQGGSERAHSVRNALAALATEAADHDWVLVHDVARPCVRVADIERLLATVATSAVGGILATPVSDTLKEVSGEEIQATRDRSSLWAALTPQMFRFALLRDALDNALAEGVVPTDEAMAVERAGHKPMVVAGSRDNIKITLREDIAIAEAILRWQEADTQENTP